MCQEHSRAMSLEMAMKKASLYELPIDSNTSTFTITISLLNVVLKETAPGQVESGVMNTLDPDVSLSSYSDHFGTMSVTPKTITEMLKE